MSKPKILVARAVFPQTIAKLQQHFEVESNQDDVLWSKSELIARLQGKQGVFTTGGERIDAALLAAEVEGRWSSVAIGRNVEVTTLELRDVTGDGAPEVRLALGDATKQGPVRTVRSPSPLPLRRWVTLDVVHDGTALHLAVDGRVVGQVDALGGPLQRDGDVFEVSPGNAALSGLVDEIQLWAYQLADPVDLPSGAEITGLEGGLRFLPTGEPETVCEVTLKTGEQTERHRVAPGGVLQ